MHNEIRLFRKKPVEVQAWRYPSEPTVYDNAFLHRWINDLGGKTQVTERGNAIQTLEGFLLITPGDWIIRGVRDMDEQETAIFTAWEADRG